MATGEFTPNLIVVGWLIVDRLGKVETRALSDARDHMLASLEQTFEQFTWRMPVVQRLGPRQREATEPVKLLKDGLQERDLQHWDFTFVVTRTPLQAHYKPYALAVPSRALGVAVVSTSHLTSQAGFGVVPSQELGNLLSSRMVAVGLHLLADLNGLSHSTQPTRFTFESSTASDLDGMHRFSDGERKLLYARLADVADTRLEEKPGALHGGSLRFYLKAIRIGLDDIVSAVVQAKPWQFPYRLNRLTTAATTTLVIFLMTAEVWDLGVDKALSFVAGLSFLALVITSTFIVKHHKLILHRGGRELTEQTVIKNVSIVIVVFLGMVTTFLLLFALSSLFMLALFDSGLVHEWTGSSPNTLHAKNYLALAGMISSLGILIGALGASFEEEYHFQHIIYVDEET